MLNQGSLTFSINGSLKKKKKKKQRQFLIRQMSQNWMWDKQIYHFVGFRKERGIRWKGLSSSLLDFLISPFSFFHSEHIPVLTVHVANNTNRTTTGQHKNTPKKGNEETFYLVAL